MRKLFAVLMVSLAAFVLTAGPGARGVGAQFDPPSSFDVMEKTIPQLQAAMASGAVTSKQLVKLYLERIAAYEPTLNAFITVNPRVVAEAEQRDLERTRGQIRGPLHGMRSALKDNVLTTDLTTTGGALAWARLRPPYEATRVTRLRGAGAVIIGKTVMTELANWVSDAMPGNYSAVGQCGYNPWDPRQDPRPGTDVRGFPFADGRPALATGGSSSGIATSANLAAANIGTETSGSILSPSNQNMLVGIKPTVGLISRHGVIPITADQDTAGPMTRDVASAAIMLNAMAGPDPLDTPAFMGPPACAPADYTQSLDAHGLSGARIAIPKQ